MIDILITIVIGVLVLITIIGAIGVFTDDSIRGLKDDRMKGRGMDRRR